ncbi:MAG: hypothetical protein GTO45_25725 [Candidatus Aminicenantes bacterium]|nr:hypothetical protein [Candidatus Aminicenantes bacterium]NIM84654.1 hypothetical protein [Candidatus Aminicenantes bacterium]NIN21539.1 hypothetical protein [Candidatus Aminicenantes bacterium]NIN45348.1 hypothetical protein [Candidatus Aminicenantes bacterium]NIN88169.1 hypothetical protein [Candidatus Aminicenantes bacterium]
MKRSDLSSVGFAVILIVFTLIVFLGLNGCKSKEKPGQREITYTLTTAEVISHVTSGTISSTNEIILRFVRPEIDADQVGSVLKKQIFYFQPGIKGTASWKDRRTVVFKPREKLPFRRDFSGEIRLNELFPKYNHLKPITIGFSVAGREILSTVGDFELVRKNNPSLVKYKNTITFTEPIEIEKVKKAVSFSIDSRTIPLEWQVHPEKGNKKFTFISAPLKRTMKTKYFLLGIEKKTAELSSTYERHIELPPLKALTITGLRKFDQGERPGIEITFSDPLDPYQDKTGLVRIARGDDNYTSALDLQADIKTVGKSLFVEGGFLYGESYTIKIFGIKSKWGTKLNMEIERKFDFEDKKPEICFLGNGVFLPSANRQRIGFKTINVKRVHLEIKKVFESNLCQFLQTEKISSNKQRNFDFNHQYVHRVGVTAATRTLDIGETKNKWLTHELDLKKLIKPGEKGLFLIKLSFSRGDMMYDGMSRNRRYYSSRDYYTNPNSKRYLKRHGHIYKPVVLSDIGLLYKKSVDGHLVFASHIITAAPLKNVKITLRTFQDQVIATAYTNRNGEAVFANTKEKVFYIEAEKNGQRSFIIPGEMAWNLSTFDTGGEELKPRETRAFIYTERGVYRPGDEINISLLARNYDNTFPDDHPVTLKIYNPKNQLIYNKTRTDGKDGFYSFKFKTKPEDPSGNWKAEFLVGSRAFYHTLKIEMVAPYRLKVKIEPEKPEISANDKKITFSVSSNYLFGSPAASLKTQAIITLNHRSITFPGYRDFIFDNESIKFKPIKQTIFDGTLDENGKAKIQWDLPDLDAVPSSATARITARVYEKGGRPSMNERIIRVHPFDYYIGLQKPAANIRPGSSVRMPAVLVNRKGESLAGRGLKYYIYENTRNWWWEYDDISRFRVRYKNDRYTRLVKEGTLVSKNEPVLIEFTPGKRAEYLIEVRETTQNGHKAGIFYGLHHRDGSDGDADNLGILILKADKKVFHPGETARISFPKPGKGLIHVSVEKTNRILYTRVYPVESIKGDKFEARIPVSITDEMVPNVYVSVSIIQPHSETKNDRPIRMYGVIPLLVKDPDTQQHIKINMAETLKSNKDFEVEIQTMDRKPTQFTIAVVDEGLLDITRFPTPDPWRHFFKKQRLAVKTFDLFSYVIGAHKGDIFRLFSIGGDIDADDSYRSSKLSAGKVRRFKPISMFKGPVFTDENGYAKISFKMPNYIGSVRVMVVSAKGNCYGKAEKAVPVKTDLMVLPTLPRVLSPGDRVVVPVSVFALRQDIKDVDVSIHAEGPVDIVGEGRRALKFEKPGEQEVKFSLQVKQAVGSAAITIKAVSSNLAAHKKIDIKVRPNSPCVYDSETIACKSGNSVEFIIPDRGIPGSNRVSVSIQRKQKLNMNHRLGWLIRYPYGCIEQTTSSLFPQLYLKSFLEKSRKDEKNIDNNINAGIQRLRWFQTPSGGFSYWPGGRSANIWGTNYGCHFLVEAQKLGYHVPEGLLKGLIRFQKSRALMDTDNLLERTYRLYILALAGEPQVGPMNLLKENHLSRMPNAAKWMLAAAYYLSGRKETAKRILIDAETTVKSYSNYGRTYGSRLRDQAIILEVAVLTEDWNRADVLYEYILNQISSKSWYSTQTLGYSLLAVGKYIRVNALDERQEKPLMSGYIKLPGKQQIPFETDKIKLTFPVEQGFGQNGKVYISKNSAIKRVIVVVEWDGVPLYPDIKDKSKNLGLTVEWLNEMGERIDTTDIKQGTAFWGHFNVYMNIYRSGRLDELALVQVLPAGWEIENIRLLKQDMPRWMKRWKLNNEEYLDIRDDRIMWFFDFPNSNTTYDFVVKLNAVTVGEFTLPPTLFEAMYDNKYKAVRVGKKVTVSARDE